MRVLLDTNVLLDIYLDRPEFAASLRVLQAQKNNQIRGYVSASSLTDIYYIARRQKGRDVARKAVRLCLDVFDVCKVDDQLLEQAYALAGQDFEDDLQIASVQFYGLNAIVTRDKDDFENSPVPVVSPDELLEQINQEKDD